MTEHGLGLQPRALLAHAEQLVEPPTRRMRISETDLRRCASACYYALFHAISAAVAAHLLPNACAADRARLARSVDHDAVGRVCRWIARGSTPPTHVSSLVDGLRDQETIIALADAYLELGQRRQAADYDPLVAHTAAMALELLRTSESAVSLLVVLTAKRTSPAAALYALIALTTRTR